MENKKHGRKAKRPNPTHGAMLVILFVSLVLLAVVLISGYGLQQKIYANESRVNELKELIDSEEARAEEIEGLEEYMQSDEYLEQEAKDRLGFVKDGEIIFKESK